MSDWPKVWALLSGKREVDLLVHEKPDGDCLGSALAMALCLKELKFSPRLLLPEKLPGIYEFLPGREFVEITTETVLKPQSLVIAIDCADVSRLGYTLPEQGCILNIDHHVSNERYGSLNIVDTTAGAAGEIIYRLLRESQTPVTPDIATCLYVALATDTGTFSYTNTTLETFRIAGELVSSGADMAAIRFNLYEQRPLTELLMVKEALVSLLLSSDGQVISCVLPYENMKDKNLLNVEADGLLNLMRSTKGVELALLFKEIEPGIIKVSLRSKSFFDVNSLAREYSGGGHPCAAGCTIKGELDPTRKMVLERANEIIKENYGRSA